MPHQELCLECRQLIRVVVLQVLDQVPEDDVVVEPLRFAQGCEAPPSRKLLKLMFIVVILYCAN